MINSNTLTSKRKSHGENVKLAVNLSKTQHYCLPDGFWVSCISVYLLSAKYGFDHPRILLRKPRIHALRSKSEDHILACAICRLRLRKPDQSVLDQRNECVP